MKLSQFYSMSFLLVYLLLLSCGTVENVQKEQFKAAEEETVIQKKPLNPDYDAGSNILYHQGWKISAPPEFYFTVPHSLNKENQLLSVMEDGAVMLSLNEAKFFFNSDYNSMISYVDNEIKENYKTYTKGTLTISETDDSRKTADYWCLESDAVLIEKIDNSYYEWRINCRVDENTEKSKILLRIMKEAGQIDKDFSGRYRKNGLSFIAAGSPWQWRGDIGDGFLLDCRVPENEPCIIAAVFSTKSIDSSDEWFKKAVKEPLKTIPVEAVISGMKIKTEMIVHRTADNFGRGDYLRLIIPVKAGNLYDHLSVFIYYEVPHGENPDPLEIFNSEKIQRLLKLNILLPLKEAL